MIKLIQESFSVEEWSEIPDCPIQRNTEMHAVKARNNHLKNSSPTHARVSAARLPGGEMFKLDGHTRAHLWEEGSLQPPSNGLKVDMYLVDNMVQVEELYKQFDSQYATETASDRLHGAYRLHRFSPESTLIRTGGVTSAVSICLRSRHAKMNIYQSIGPFVPALQIIDRQMFINRSFPSGVLAAMILTVAKHKNDAIGFWRKYHDDEGMKNGKERDGVQALTEVVHSYRSESKIGGGAAAMYDLCGKSISAFNSYRAGRKYRSGIKASDFSSYTVLLSVAS